MSNAIDSFTSREGRMNDTKIEQYKTLLKLFPKDEYDAALDGLISGTSSLKLPADGPPKNGGRFTEAELFLLDCMNNRVRNKHRDERRQKEPTKTNSNTPIQEKEITKKNKRVKQTFEMWYPEWLINHNTSDSIRNRSAAESDWDSIATYARQQPVELSMNTNRYGGNIPDNPQSKELSTLRDKDQSPEQKAMESEEVQRMSELKEIKDTRLREFLHKHIHKTSNRNEMETLFQVAMLKMVSEFPNWRLLPTSDLMYLCRETGSKIE